MRIFLFFITLLLIPFTFFGQQSNSYIEISGQVLNKKTKEPISYAAIRNLNLNTGSITDEDGHFSVKLKSLNDSVLVSFIGYQQQLIAIDRKAKVYTVLLKESVQLLKSVTISAIRNDWIYDLLNDCQRNSTSKITTSKAYYELQSFCDEDQIELVEAFFNADLKGAELMDLEMKTGRFGLRKIDNRFFTSQGSSRAIIQSKLFNKNKYFPFNPLETSIKLMKKRFSVFLERKYLDYNLDSIYIIDYSPKDTLNISFSGKIWINPELKTINKITYNCEDCGKHPFLPLFPTDSILGINMNIIKEFNEVNGKMEFKQTNFSYDFSYLSRFGSKEQKHEKKEYSIQSRAIIYAYDYEREFNLPEFKFSENCVRDYQKINAIPYNEFFWLNNNEFKIVDFEDKNEKFYYQQDVITNRTWYADNPFFKKVYESPFIKWSPKRILMKDVSNTASGEDTHYTQIIAQRYELGAKIFMDVNTYADSIHVITSTVFDPWDTYYHLPVDSVTDCFLNIYFDICEIERQKFEKEINRVNRTEQFIIERHNQLTKNLKVITARYLKDVDRGTERKQLERWNEYVNEKLEIDNIKLFQLTFE